MQTIPCTVPFGTKFKGHITLDRESVMAYNNPQISNMLPNACSKMKEAFRSRYVKSLESLSEHTKSFPPLNCGDH